MSSPDSEVRVGDRIAFYYDDGATGGIGEGHITEIDNNGICVITMDDGTVIRRIRTRPAREGA